MCKILTHVAAELRGSKRYMGEQASTLQIQNNLEACNVLAEGFNNTSYHNACDQRPLAMSVATAVPYQN